GGGVAHRGGGAGIRAAQALGRPARAHCGRGRHLAGYCLRGAGHRTQSAGVLQRAGPHYAHQCGAAPNPDTHRGGAGLSRAAG
nr:hypothetical protein [Tanacetum cinerariifolium]